VVVTVNELLLEPITKFALIALVISGAMSTVTCAVMLAVAGVVAALVTVNVYVVVVIGETVAGVPLVAGIVVASTLFVMTPVPPVNTGSSVVEFP
jgi:hypothetical protein